MLVGSIVSVCYLMFVAYVICLFSCLDWLVSVVSSMILVCLWLGCLLHIVA